jgi:hypothetical protein
MKKTVISALMLIVAVVGNGQKTSFQKDQKNFSNEAVQTMNQLKKTSPFLLNDKRIILLNKFQTYSDSLPYTTFDEYLISPEQKSVNMEHTMPILYCYRNAFDKVIDEVKNTKVKKGTVVVWMLYNMGVVIKTPSGCFGIDINHRWAEKFEPYLDFLCVTHNHEDHKSTELMEAMNSHGKPVLSNFYNASEKYVSTKPASYKIGNFSIRTNIADHNSKLLNYITVFRVDCGEDAGNFSILNCGDANFNPKQFTNVQGPINLVILRYGAPVENNILGTGEGQVKPDYAVLSHIIELRHRIKESPRRASITETLEHLPDIKCENTILPFWGEKLTWKNGKMY